MQPIDRIWLMTRLQNLSRLLPVLRRHGSFQWLNTQATASANRRRHFRFICSNISSRHGRESDNLLLGTRKEHVETPTAGQPVYGTEALHYWPTACLSAVDGPNKNHIARHPDVLEILDEERLEAIARRPILYILAAAVSVQVRFISSSSRSRCF